ncbi:hypothetical protein LSH36_3175g00000 [Paralvinella palmiformis]|uniref:Uncharacterized protein n=1 Tax=Paralvinella palmiformis TaxID=53620 RepID=A0AAD9INM9_9ANNE|nr:hypothetical protein LSH36_3175g00000 [Paralvinella palmiformis]
METVSVTKSCSLPEICSNIDIGCRVVNDTESECISCCTESYCNEEIPHDHVSAFRFSITLLRSATFRPKISSHLIFIVCLIFI